MQHAERSLVWSSFGENRRDNSNGSRTAMHTHNAHKHTPPAPAYSYHTRSHQHRKNGLTHHTTGTDQGEFEVRLYPTTPTSRNPCQPVPILLNFGILQTGLKNFTKNGHQTSTAGLGAKTTAGRSCRRDRATKVVIQNFLHFESNMMSSLDSKSKTKQ